MNVRRGLLHTALLAGLLAMPSGRAEAELDIKRVAPADAHTLVYIRRNPEREYQAAYLADAWKTFRDERIAERIYDIIVKKAPADKLEEFKKGWAEIETALEPINLAALAECEEFVSCNIMVGPFGHTILAVRLSEEDAEEYRQGVGNLFAVFQKWSEDKVTTESTDSSGVKVTKLQLPEEVPYQPAVACLDDLFLVSTSDTLLARCLEQLQSESGASKFDDARLKEALAALPAAEDSLTFFDADQLFKNLGGLGDFIREQSKEGDKEKVDRAVRLLDQVIEEMDALEYETLVEYTEEGQNRAAALGKWADDGDETLLGRALGAGKPFENWMTWVPADATSYSLSTGINLHEIYVGVMSFVREEIPESHEALDQWAAMQEKVGVNLDEDVLQAFTGENVSLTLADGQTVNALKCSNPEKIRELLDRAIQGLKQVPAVQQQGLELVECDDAALEGFQEVRAAVLAMTPAKPVIGFHEGWMVIASSPAAAKKFLAVRAGDEPSIEGAESLAKFDLKTEGPVHSVSYSDVGASVRAVADGINQFAMMAPMVMGAAMQGLSPEDRKTVQEALSLLPSIAKVIRKFDFYERKLSITRKGPLEDTYLRESVTLVRKPADN
ncbi:MAG TPA: hypothetical protein VEQ85_05435 [Lacipirellulaceae bacterium]|nr:hypothetical protein [Lacipirellulaceae bacterium]